MLKEWLLLKINLAMRNIKKEIEKIRNIKT